MKDTTKQTFENVDIIHRWPTQPKSDLDASQLEALRRILTKRLAIVQGPPGTGKTHVSVQAIKVMLDNRKEDDPPIIVACQTNHAVDQLLRHIAKFEPDFVRLGGRSKDQDVIKSRTLFNVRKQTSENNVPGSMAPTAKRKIVTLEKELSILLSPLTASEVSERKPLDFRTLERFGLLTQAQANSLETGASKWIQDQLVIPGGARSPFTVWLGSALITVAQKQIPEEFGFEFEEADLEMEQLKEMEAENVAKDDEDFETLRGLYIPLADHFTSKKTPGITEAKAQDSLKKFQDLWRIPESLRPAVYRHLQTEAKNRILTSFRQTTKEFNNQAMRRRIGYWEKDEPLLKKQKIIGMTTTGLSKYRGLLSALQPKIVLIEEAAETLEAPVTVACMPSLQHLILVGDHQQLRPHCHVKAHEDEPYYLNISLFERMVKNGIDFTTLSVQRRMIPEVRRVLQPIYGNKITDHPSVSDPDNRPNVPGMGGINSWFFTHQRQEQRDELMSIYNSYEADMIVGFVEYLVYNGMDTEDITVLTFYNGQRKKILGELRKKVSLGQRRFNVVTVDSYQGEENNVVILSLVRSNERGRIGFLSIDNRVCVALSRAQCGFYIFGNAHMLYAVESQSPEERVYQTWAKVIDIMANNGKKKSDRLKVEPTNRLDIHLPVRCSNHGKETIITEPEDWDLYHGGCSAPCGDTLACGHPCELKCHPFSHDMVQCQQGCGKTLHCCGRQCEKKCGELCACEVCSKRPATIPTLDDYDSDRLPQVLSSGQASSAESWQSFAKEEPIRYAEAIAVSNSQRTSPVKSLNAHHQTLRIDSLPDAVMAADAAKKFQALQLDSTSAKQNATSTSSDMSSQTVKPMTGDKLDDEPTQIRGNAKGGKGKEKVTPAEENLIDFD